MNIKKIITIVASIFLSISSYTQSTNKKIEQYCELTSNADPFSKKVSIRIDYGKEQGGGIFNDWRLKSDSGTVIKFNTIIDALNYMGKNGWKLIFVYSYSASAKDYNTIYYLFKKEFDEQ